MLQPRHALPTSRVQLELCDIVAVADFEESLRSWQTWCHRTAALRFRRPHETYEKHRNAKGDCGKNCRNTKRLEDYGRHAASPQLVIGLRGRFSTRGIAFEIGTNPCGAGNESRQLGFGLMSAWLSCALQGVALDGPLFGVGDLARIVATGRRYGVVCAAQCRARRAELRRPC